VAATLFFGETGCVADLWMMLGLSLWVFVGFSISVPARHGAIFLLSVFGPNAGFLFLFSSGIARLNGLPLF
jgi:hypothetical protein